METAGRSVTADRSPRPRAAVRTRILPSRSPARLALLARRRRARLAALELAGVVVAAIAVALAFGWLAGVATALGAALVTGIAAAVYLRLVGLARARQLAEITAAVETLAARDVAALGDALAELAQGESARPIAVDARPVAVPSDPTLRRLAEAVNTTIVRLESSIEQFNLGTLEPCRRAFYVGPDDFLLGATCAEEMARLVPRDAQLLVLVGRFVHAGMELRRRGFESAMRERLPDAHVVAATENTYDAEFTYDYVASFLRSHPLVRGIYAAEGRGVQGAAEAVQDLGRAGEIVIICHDLLDETMPYVRSGTIAGTVTQDAFGQAYETAIHLFNHLAFGWQPAETRLTTRTEFVTRENLDHFWLPRVGAIEPKWLAETRPKPFGPASRPIRIAIVGVCENPFWNAVRAGAQKASEDLSGFGCRVDWFEPELPDSPISILERMVDAAMNAHYDAIASPVFDLGLVAHLNRAVDAGIAVATYNSEAASLGGLITSLSRQRRRLEARASRLELSATRDPLTGAGNRQSMEAELPDLLRRVDASGEPATLAMVDIDHFKAYNDRNGHVAGDAVLRAVVSAIRGAIRPEDRIYRYGGEEFLVVLERADTAEGQAAGARIVSVVRALGIPHPDNVPWGVVTVSAGVAGLAAGAEIRSAIETADAALYESKAAGRNRLTGR